MPSFAHLRAETIEPSDGNIVIFNSVLDEPALRELINGAVTKCSGLAAVFSGSDEAGYRYIIGSRKIDLRAAAKQINSGINGRGGGSSEMIQGSCKESAENIQKFLSIYNI